MLHALSFPVEQLIISVQLISSSWHCHSATTSLFVCVCHVMAYGMRFFVVNVNRSMILPSSQIFFKDSSSHQIFRYMHEALNIDKENN